ncbi:MAG: chemotaxis protein CheA [Myxococcota bacterium]
MLTGALLTTFLDEARELLAGMQGALLDFERTQDRAETVRAVFRAAHTIKGSSGLFGLQHVVRFAHVLESLLEALRAEPERLSKELVALLLEAHDELHRSLEAVERGETREAPAELVARFEAFGARAAGSGAAPQSQTPTAPAERRWALDVSFGPDTFRDGFDPLSFLRFLETLGRVEHVRLDESKVPTDERFDPETCFLDFHVELTSAATRERLLAVFDFVREGSRLELVPLVPAPAAAEPAPSPAQLPPAAPAATENAAPPAPPPRVAAPERLVKVPATRLDALVDMVSELVIASATASVRAGRVGDRDTVESLGAMTKLIASIRDAALGLRMVQIGETFDRFRRVIREVATQLGKEVEVTVRGGETELDKAMVERLADPLLHIVRNAIDHGIEKPEVREAAGKPRAGRLVFEARHHAGQIIIDVRDDGAGLNRARIRQKAIERGLVSARAELTEAQIDDLIFAPGLSSAEVVTDVSGRGVGMDVVRRALDQLRGSVEVLSTAGQGTTLRLTLPLTLAIIDGFLLGVGDAHFVVPSKQVRECLDFATLVESEENHRLDLRGEPVPFVRLRDFFRLGGARPRRESVVIIEQGERRIALVVDRLLGVSHTVIKPLGPLFRRFQGVGGSTVLGTGDVALIIDLPQFVRLIANAPPGARERTLSVVQTAA